MVFFNVYIIWKNRGEENLSVLMDIYGYLNVFDVKTCVCLKKNFCKKLMLKCENFVEISFDIK